MKFLFVLFLGLSATVAIHLGYKRGKRYTYHYEAIIAHGIPDAFKNDMALVVKATAHLDYLESTADVVLKLEVTEIATLKGEILDSDRLIRDDVTREKTLQVELKDRIKKCLEMAVKFQFKDNRVEREIIASKDDPIWCVNMKRGVINYLYLPITDNNEDYQTRQREVSVLGICKTTYTIINKKPYYRVKRVVDMDRCVVRPELAQTNIPNIDEFIVRRQGRNTAPVLPNFLRSAAHMDYELEGDTEKGFIIRKVVGESEYDLTLMGDEYQSGKAVGARIRQTLTIHEKEQPLPPNGGVIPEKETRGGLLFVYDNGAKVTRTDEAQKNILAEVEKHISTLKEQIETGMMKPEAAQAFTRLVSSLRRCTAASLRIVAEECLATENVELRKLLLDAFSRIGTIDAGVVIKGLVTGGKLENHLERVMVGLGWPRFSKILYISQIMAICKDGKVDSKFQAKQACWLSFGNLMNHLMRVLRRYPRLAHDTKVQVLTNIYAKTLRESLENAKDDEEKLIFIKAIGNAGWIRTDVFKAVVTVITNAKTPLHVQHQAIWALRHMARFAPLMVRQYLLPIFANPLRDAELRIACYKILLQSDPSIHTCQMMANVISRESVGQGPRSNQVVSFMASDLRTSINHDKHDVVKASRARLLLRFLPRKVAFDMFTYSKGINVVLDSARKAAVELRVNKINGRDTFITRNLNAKIRLHTPGLSANLMEFGARIQGIHDKLQPFFEPKKGDRRKRSLDILNYIFGVTSDDEKETTKKLPPRFSLYFKLFGSEMYYGKLVKEDLKKIIEDALFGEGETTEGGITFSKTGIKMDKNFATAQILSETRYMIPTFMGIPLKVSNKVTAAVKGRIMLDIKAEPQLINSKFESVKSTILVKPEVAIHMHNKIGVNLPVFETGVIVKNDLLTAPKYHMVFTLNEKGYNLAYPVSGQDQQILDTRSQAHAVIRKEFTPGLRTWENVDLEMKQRGMVKVPKTCYGKEYFGFEACIEGTKPDFGYIRTKRLPAFPYLVMSNMNVALKSATDPPAEVTAHYQTTTTNAKTYEGKGTIDFSGATKKRTITFEPRWDKKASTCDIPWTMENEKCSAACKANTNINWGTLNKIAMKHIYGDKNLNTDVTFENDGKLMRIVNTWNKLPELVRKQLTYYHPQIIVLLHQYFAIEGVVNQTPEKKCEVRVNLYDKFTADICIDAPRMRLRRINQELPFALPKFPTTKMEIKQMLKSRYATCHVKGTNYIRTTDNVVIKEEIPGTCPFVLARDARSEKPTWQVLIKLNKQAQKELIIHIVDLKIELLQDMSVKVNGNPVKIDTEHTWAGVRIQRVNGNQLYVEAEVGFQCLFDGPQVVLRVTPWWHNRIHGLCGDNDGEQWTDFKTRAKTFIPETMPKEFVREWVVQGKVCGDKQCQLEAKRVELTHGAPTDQVCFTNGRFLQCMKGCKPLTKHTVNVAHHCVDKKKQNDKSVDYANMSVDRYDDVVEHLSCECTCP